MRLLTLAIIILMILSVANSGYLVVGATPWFLNGPNGRVGGGYIFDNPIDNGSCFSVNAGGLWCQ